MIRDPTTLAQANINKKMSLYSKRRPLIPYPARLQENKVLTEIRPRDPVSTRSEKINCKTAPSLYSERANVDLRGCRTHQDLARIGSHLR